MKKIVQDAISLVRVSRIRLAEAKRIYQVATNLKDKTERHKQKSRALALVDELSERADQEPDGSDEPSVGSDHPIDAEKDTSDDEPDYDNEPKNYLPLALTLAEEE